MNETAGHHAASLLTRLASRPGLVIAVWLAIAALSGLGASRIHPTPSIASMLDEDNPATRSLAAVTERFSVGDEVIVVASVPESVDSRASRARLSAFAESLAQQIDNDASAALCRRVTYRKSGGMRRFLESKILPSALYYVDDSSFTALTARFAREAIDRQLERNAELLATPGPAGNAIAKSILRDPLRLHEFLMPALGRGEGLSLDDGGNEFLFSRNARSVMIRIAGHEPAGHTDYARRIVQAVKAAVGRVNVDGLQIAYAGGYAIATTAERSIRGDMIRSIVMSAVLLTVLFLVVYRHWAAALLALSPVALGIVAAFGLGSFLTTELTPLVAVIGAVLAGLGIDYCIHFLSHYDGVRAVGEPHGAAVASTVRSVGPAMLAACVTSVIGFAAISQSSVRALQHFSIIGALGLAYILLAAVTWLPALLGLLRRGAADSRPPRLFTGAVRPLLTTLSNRPRRWLAASLVVVAVAFATVLLNAGGASHFDTDLTVMHPRPNAPLDTQHRLTRDFDYGGDGLIVHIEGNDEADVLSLSHRVAARLDTDEARAAGIKDTLSLANLLPNPQYVKTRSAQIRDLDSSRIVADFRAALEDSPFEPTAYDGYVKFLRRLLSGGPPPTMHDVAAEPQIASLIFPRQTDSPGVSIKETLAHVRLAAPLTQRADRDRVITAARAALDGLSGVTLTGISVVGFDTERHIRGDLARLLAVAAILVVVWLVLYFRSVRAVALSLLPACFGLLCLLALMYVLDLRLNAVNLIGLPLLVGIGVDDGIFLVSLSRAAKRRASGGLATNTQLASGCHAILMTTLTTLLTFGTLAFTATPAIRSLGVLLTIGMIGCLAGTLFLLAPILLWRTGRV